MEQNSNKKIKLVSSHKKQQEQKKHASNCDDVNCKGCEVGEIKIVFTGNGEEGVNNEIELNPYQLFQEEAISEVNNGGEYNEIAKKLFEMALEGFGKLLLEKSESQEKLKKKNDDDDDEPVVTT